MTTAAPIRESIRSHYRTGSSNLGRDFFSPCLRACASYERACGYFSSSSLITWAEALPHIARTDDTTIRLLISPALTPADKEALARTVSATERERILEELGDQIVLGALEDSSRIERDVAFRLKLLSWLISSGRLEIKFAFAAHSEASGIFHEKIGIFTLPSGDRIAFTGSANETIQGHRGNYESIDVFRDWIPEDVERVATKQAQFTEAWDGTATGLCIRPLSPSALARVRSMSPDGRPTRTPQASPNDSPSDPRWRHQDEAIERFLRKKRGVLEMATGTGKTRTALRIAASLADSAEIQTIIVAADGNDLLDQWHHEVLARLSSLGRQFVVLRHYRSHHDRERLLLNPAGRVLLISRPQLAKALRGLTPSCLKKTLLVHDEVHRLGSPANRRDLDGLSDDIPFRLGLSATPEREYDDEGTRFIATHIGETIFTFELADAIRRGILCPFDYHALEYEPSDDDREHIKKVYQRQAASQRAGTPMSKEELWIELAKVHKTSLAKLPPFSAYIGQNSELLARCIIFVETMEYGDRVLPLVHRHRADFHTYFSLETPEVLSRFARGDLECLLTCHRLSEGIDIKSLETVILFSSARARLETIQRIGRCLRSDPRNPAKRAKVIDFVRRASPDASKGTADDDRRDWLSELSTIEPETDR